MQLYKLVGNTAVPYSGQAVILSGKVITRPDEDILTQLGYMPMGDGVIPEYDAETQYPVVVHHELSADGKEIIPVYGLADVQTKSDDTQSSATTEERIAALEEELKAAKILLGLEV